MFWGKLTDSHLWGVFRTQMRWRFFTINDFCQSWQENLHRRCFIGSQMHLQKAKKQIEKKKQGKLISCEIHRKYFVWKIWSDLFLHHAFCQKFSLVLFLKKWRQVWVNCLSVNVEFSYVNGKFNKNGDKPMINTSICCVPFYCLFPKIR